MSLDEQTLTDDDIRTSMTSPAAMHTGSPLTASADADGTDADGTDADGTDADSTDGDASDTADGDASDA